MVSISYKRNGKSQMSSPAVIPLAKGYKPEKLIFPVMVSEKLDGVPIRMDYIPKFGTTGMSRQGKSKISIQDDMKEFHQCMENRGLHAAATFVGEVTSSLVSGFKDVSGTIGRHKVAEGLQYNFFEYVRASEPLATYDRRTVQLSSVINSLQNPKFRFIPQYMCHDMNALTKFFHNNPIRRDQEGWVIRSLSAVWKPDSRYWDYQKIVVTPSEDLPLEKVDEAVSKDGVPLAMAGKLWAMYNGNLIGVGPGKLTHPERHKLWLQYQEEMRKGTWKKPMMEVTYKRDPTYDALREARFTCWRPDKD